MWWWYTLMIKFSCLSWWLWYNGILERCMNTLWIIYMYITSPAMSENEKTYLPTCGVLQQKSKKWIRKIRDHIIHFSIFLCRKRTKTMFNPQFGSLFRTYHNPTYFSRRLHRFADIYTASLTNLLHYSPRHTFYPRRGALAHENVYHSLWL